MNRVNNRYILFVLYISHFPFTINLSLLASRFSPLQIVSFLSYFVPYLSCQPFAVVVPTADAHAYLRGTDVKQRRVDKTHATG